MTATLEIMTAKERLLRVAPRWSEHDAEVALQAVEREHGVKVVDEWGDLDAFCDAASRGTMRALEDEEAAIGFSWEQRPPS